MKEDIARVIETSKIKPSKFNLRKYDDVEPEDSKEFLQLCFNIKENGLIEPIIVRKSADGYEAVSGSRRLRALKKINAKNTTAVIKDLTDNDARVISLAENIVRKGMNDDSKVISLEEIYKSGNKKWDRQTAIQYLSAIRNREYKERKRENLILNNEYLRLNPKGAGEKLKVDVPEEFWRLYKRIGYSASYQYNMLKGYGEYEDDDTDWIKELPEPLRPELNDPIFENKPVIQQEAARRASKKKNPREARQVLRQAAWDIKTGAITEDEEGVSYSPSKRENLYAPTEENPVQARQKITDYAEKMYKLITGIEMSSNVDTAETQAISQQATHNMKEVCSYGLTLRELPSLEYVITPLQKALNKFVDVMYNVQEKREVK